jgi:hypothetical protein
MATGRPHRQNIRAIKSHAGITQSHAGSTQAMPDNRVLLTLDDGRSFVIDAERLKPQADGTYRVHLTSGDLRITREHLAAADDSYRKGSNVHDAVAGE